jgi:uncharacterized protein YndB with AHSA1/START domain
MKPPANAYIEPVVKSVRVRATPSRAFDVFTAGMGRWWIRSHSINPTKSPIAAVVIEPRAGGRWYERGEDGSECDWGRVLAWEPPTRVVLGWQLDAKWAFDPDLVTELEIRFDAADDGHTQVRLEHRHLERFGSDAETVRNALASPGGWTALLEAYEKALA